MCIRDRWERSVRVRVTLDYSLLGRVENALAQTPYVREDTVFADAVTLQLLVRARQVDALRAQFADWTDARARVEAAPEAFFHPWPTDA